MTIYSGFSHHDDFPRSKLTSLCGFLGTYFLGTRLHGEGEVHANLGRFFFLEGRLPLGTYHLSKERGGETAKCLDETPRLWGRSIQNHPSNLTFRKL